MSRSGIRAEVFHQTDNKFQPTIMLHNLMGKPNSCNINLRTFENYLPDLQMCFHFYYTASISRCP